MHHQGNILEAFLRTVLRSGDGCVYARVHAHGLIHLATNVLACKKSDTAHQVVALQDRLGLRAA
eukprot:652657-Pleurochrysis_carterae.AAC.1